MTLLALMGFIQICCIFIGVILYKYEFDFSINILIIALGMSIGMFCMYLIEFIKYIFN